MNDRSNHPIFRFNRQPLVFLILLLLFVHKLTSLVMVSQSFLLAGGEPREEHMEGDREHRQRHSLQKRIGFQNLFSGFSEELLAEAYNIPINIARRLQEDDSQRGIVVRCQEEMRRMIRPDEEREQGERWVNGLEETICSARIRYNLDTLSESDFVSRQGGRVNIVNRHKLPILQYLDMSAEKGHLFPVHI